MEEKMRFQVLDSNSEVVGIAEGRARDFKTGSRGYNFSFKTVVNGKEYIVNGNAVEIGSKPKADKK